MKIIILYMNSIKLYMNSNYTCIIAVLYDLRRFLFLKCAKPLNSTKLTPGKHQCILTEPMVKHRTPDLRTSDQRKLGPGNVRKIEESCR